MNYFENNYILSALAALAVVIFIFIDRKRNMTTNKDPTNFLSYIKIFLAVFSITLGILFFKTKNFSLPIPKKMSGGGSTFNQPHPQVQMYRGNNNQGGNGIMESMTDLDLNNVNISDPRF
tara:strand:- start:225 stop:584 length:360 start_codon:yes stop_codon:yes gene_type:complete